jgi:hypothetical protein
MCKKPVLPFKGLTYPQYIYIQYKRYYPGPKWSMFEGSSGLTFFPVVSDITEHCSDSKFRQNPNINLDMNGIQLEGLPHQFEFGCKWYD